MHQLFFRCRSINKQHISAQIICQEWFKLVETLLSKNKADSGLWFKTVV